MAIAASFNASVFVTGTSTGLTGAPGEPMTDLGIGGARVTWQITAEAKRIIDPATPITIFDDTAGAAWGGTFTIDYLHGIVTLNAAAASTIKIQGNYLPRSEITSAYEYDVSLSKTLADVTAFSGGTNDHISRIATLSDLSGSLSCYDNTTTSYGGMTLKQVFDSTTPKVLEVNMSASILRAFVLMEGTELSMAVDGVQTLSSNFSAARVLAAGSTPAGTAGQEVDYSFSS
ncbi:MAG: hypothetical protein Unbinned3992contig1000_58 [Prokaryotic dsDNA virus sp.]|nr:MAG: hypothetical protein Unbinned3992contig1000_58 [Prokaryotic dsDNA virus sp.]|tara:strand:- start:20747 stop:21439 length:693 start_codon:yes stop_codon:yes gene_type:complete